MFALALALVLHAVPDVRPDGVWLPSKVAAAVAKGTATELDLSTGVAFNATEVTIGYGMEDETRSWRTTEAGGLEVRSGEDWRPLQWKEGKKGTVKTDIKRAGELEELTFVPGTIDQLKKDRLDKLRSSLLAKLAGKWVAAGHTLELSAQPLYDGKPVAVRSAPCNYKCEGKAPAQCAEVGDPGESRLLLPSGKKLIEVAIEGSCGVTEGTGVEPVEGGLTFEKK